MQRPASELSEAFRFRIKDPEKRAFWALVKVMFKGEKHESAGGFSGTSPKKKSRGRAGRIIRYILLTLLYLMMAGIFASLGGAMAYTGRPLAEIFRASLLINVIFNLLFGIFSAVNYLYFPKDMPFYLSLPYAAKDVIRARFLHYFSLSLLSSLMLLPMLLAALIVCRAPALHYLTGITAFLAGAASADIVLVILSILLMRFLPPVRNKERFMTIMSILMMLFGIAIGAGLQFLTNHEGGGVSQSMGRMAAFDLPFIVDFLISLVSFPLFFTAWHFSEMLPKLLLVLLLNGAGLFLYFRLMLFTADKFYLPGVTALQASGGRKSAATYSEKELARLLRPKTSAAGAFRRYQRKKLFRVPVFFNQLVLSPLIMPLIMLIFAAIGLFTQAPDELPLSFLLSEVRTITAALTLEDPVFSFLLFGLTAWIAFASLGSAIPYRLSISTDGRDFFLFKTLPVSLRSYLKGLQQCFLSLNMLPALLLFLLMAAVSGLKLFHTALLLLNSLILAYSFAAVYFIIAAARPVLDWENETALVKGDPKLALWAYSGFFILLLIAGPQLLFLGLNLHFLFMPQAFAILLSLLFNLLLAALLTYLFYGPAAKKLSRIEKGA